MDGHAMSGFLQNLTASRGDRILAGRELSLRKPPRAPLAQLNDSELWSAIVAQHDSAGCQDRYTGLVLALLHRPHLLASRHSSRHRLSPFPRSHKLLCEEREAKTSYLPPLCDGQVTADGTVR